MFDSITIRGNNHFEGSIFSVYVIDTTGPAVTETKCDYSYSPHKQGSISLKVAGTSTFTIVNMQIETLLNKIYVSQHSLCIP